MSRLNEILARAEARKRAVEGPSAAEAFGYGAADALTLGWFDEMQAGPAGAKEHWQTVTDRDVLRAYLEALRKAKPEERARIAAAFNKAFLRKDIAKGEEATEETRQAMHKARRAHPYAYTAGSIAGSVPLAATVGHMMPAGPMTLGGRAALEGLVGAGTGAIYGAGSSDDDRVYGALSGGAFGGLIGAAFPFVRAGIRKGIEAVLNRQPLPAPAFPEKGISKTASRTVIKEIIEGDSIPEVMERARLAGQQGTLMDASPAAARMAKGIYQTDVPARNRLYEFLTRRSAKSYERASQVMDDLLGKPASTKQLVEELTQRAYQQARPFYRFAETQKVPLDLVVDLADRPAFKTALRKALRMAANEGVHLDDETAKVVNALLRGNAEEVKGALPIKVVDYVQRALNDTIMASQQKAPNTARVFGNLRSELLQRIDDYVPAFKTARSIARNKFDLERAIKTGESVMNPNVMPEDIAAAVKAMTPEEQAAMRQGIRNVLRQRLENVINPAIAAERLSKRPLVAKKLQAAIGEKANELLRTVDREALFRQTRDLVTAGSHTSQNMATRFHPTERGIRGWVMRTIDWLAENGRDMNRKEMADSIATLLMDTGEARDAVLKSLEKALESKRAAEKLGKKTADFLRKWVQAQLVIPAAEQRIMGD